MGSIKLDGEEEGAGKWYQANKILVDRWFEGRDAALP